VYLTGTEEEVWEVVGGLAELPCHTVPPRPFLQFTYILFAGTEEEVWGVVGGPAELPCHTAPPPQARDSVRLVLWFKDDSARQDDSCSKHCSIAAGVKCREIQFYLTLVGE